MGDVGLVVGLADAFKLVRERVRIMPHHCFFCIRTLNFIELHLGTYR